MSRDFFARLAERALGVGVFVTPNRSPLFAGPSASTLTEVEEIADAAPSPVRQQLPASPPGVVSPSRPNGAPPPESQRPPRHQLESSEGEADRIPTDGTRQAIVPPPRADLPGHAPTQTTFGDADSTRSRPDTAATPGVIPRPAALVASPAAVSAVRPSHHAEPAPDRSFKSRSEGRQRADLGADPHGEPRIEVSIGEVVVRLVEERPGAARARPAPPRPALSLDDYLSARDGRGR